MAFGLSFAKKGVKTDQTTNLNKTETGSQSGSETTAGSRASTSTTQGTVGNQASGVSNTSGTSSQSQSSTGAQTQTGTTRTLSQPVISGLEGAVTSLLAQVLDPNSGDRAMLTRGMGAMGDFDVDSFVEGTLQSAKAQQETGLDELIGSLFSRVGGTSGNNSAATLLQERAHRDAAANLAGIGAQARAQGEQIKMGQLGAMASAIQQGGQGLLPAIASILRGAETTTEGQTLTSELANVTGQTTGQTATSESSVQTQDLRTNTTEDLIQAVLSALSQQSTTVASEHTKGKTKESGGGFSLSI